MTTLIIARHGNTFCPDDIPTRVGCKTDLSLVESGRDQAKKIGLWLKDQGLYPEVVYSAQLKRTMETATLAIQALGYKQPVYPLAIFDEIDSGPDENQPEKKVLERLGQEALDQWNNNAIVPEGWNFDPEECIQNWQNFARHVVEDEQDCVMVVTSNGIARFAPHITDNFDAFKSHHTLKLSTGALGIFTFDQSRWSAKDWNIRP